MSRTENPASLHSDKERPRVVPVQSINDQDEDQDCFLAKDDEREVPRCFRGKGCCALVVGICILWFLIVVGSGYGAMRFFHNLGFAHFHVPEGTIMRESEHMFWNTNSADDQGQLWRFPEYLLIQTIPRGESLLDVDHQLIMAAVSELLVLKLKPGAENNGVPNMRGYWLHGGDEFIDYDRESLVGGINNDTTAIVINWQGGGTKKFTPKFKHDLHSEIVQKLLPPSKYKLMLSGVGDLDAALTETVLPNMGHIDAIAITIGLLIFGIAVRAPLALPIPLVILVCTVVPTLALGDLLRQTMRVTGFAPEIMASMAIALSIDFSLFFLSRVRECHADQENFGRYTPAAVIWHSYKKVSHNIAVSAIAIALAFGGLAFINSSFVRSIALICCFAALVVLFASLTLLPALIWICYPICCCCKMLVLVSGRSNNNKENSSIGGEEEKAKTGITKRQVKTINKNSASGGRDNRCDSNVTPLVMNSTLAIDSMALEKATTPPGAEANTGDRTVHFRAMGEDEDEGGNSSKSLEKRQQAVNFAAAMASPWAKVAMRTSQFWPLTILLVLGACSPFLYVLSEHFAYDSNFLTISPHSIPAYWDYVEAEHIFGAHIDTPMSIYLQSLKDSSYRVPYMLNGSTQIEWDTVDGKLPILSPELWPVFDHIMDAVDSMPDDNTIKSEGLKMTNCPNWWKGNRLTWYDHVHLVNQALAPNYFGYNGSIFNKTFQGNFEEGHEYVNYLKTFTGPAFWTTYYARNQTLFGGNGALIQKDGNWSGSGSGVVNFGMAHSTWGKWNTRYWSDLHAVVLAVRQRIWDVTNSSYEPTGPALANYDNYGPDSLFVGFMGPNGSMWYVLTEVMKQFKTEIFITVGMLFGAMLLLFRSVAISLISIFTMALTVSTSFGVVTTVFHYDWLDGLWKELHQIDAYYWVIVVLAFSICCVLSLDYNVFMVVRILEFRSTGQSNRNSVVAAVGKTGPVISFAALIMMVAFGGLIVANTMMLNQFGLTLTIAVFMDAFMVRPILVPALVMIFPGKTLWFPRSVPAVIVSREEQLENNKSAFTMYDVDGDGKISPRDLKETLQTMKQAKDMSDKELDGIVKRAFTVADSDGDGFISFEEFDYVLTKVGKLV